VDRPRRPVTVAGCIGDVVKHAQLRTELHEAYATGQRCVNYSQQQAPLNECPMLNERKNKVWQSPMTKQQVYRWVMCYPSNHSALSNWRCIVFLSGPCEGAAQIEECAIITAHITHILQENTQLQFTSTMITDHASLYSCLSQLPVKPCFRLT
jgi:hypothetical protein